MAPASIAETFDDRWARWQAAAAAQDRTWRRAAIATSAVMFTGMLAWLAVALLGA